MVLKRVLPARQSRLLVTAPSSRNVNMVDDEDDESEQGMTTTSSSSLGTRKKSESAQRGLGLTDTIGIELAIVFGAAIFFRRLWILHFIHFIVLRRTLILAIAWIDYFFDAGLYEEVKRTALYIYRISMSHTEKALSGDSMRLFFAASWLQVNDFCFHRLYHCLHFL